MEMEAIHRPFCVRVTSDRLAERRGQFGTRSGNSRLNVVKQLL